MGLMSRSDRLLTDTNVTPISAPDPELTFSLSESGHSPQLRIQNRRPIFR